jgi:hypothetical protein
MDIPERLFTDPRFLEAMRLLLQRYPTRQALPDEEETADDLATRAVRAKIALRMKKRKTKE